MSTPTGSGRRRGVVNRAHLHSGAPRQQYGYAGSRLPDPEYSKRPVRSEHLILPRSSLRPGQTLRARTRIWSSSSTPRLWLFSPPTAVVGGLESFTYIEVHESLPIIEDIDTFVARHHSPTSVLHVANLAGKSPYSKRPDAALFRSRDGGAPDRESQYRCP